MSKIGISLFVIACAVITTGCSSKCNVQAVGSPRITPGAAVYRSPCDVNAAPYESKNCDPIQVLSQGLEDVRCPLRGLGLPGLSCVREAPAAPAPKAEAPTCGPFPAEAKPGEVWCCEWVQPPAAAPVQVLVSEAHEEIQRVTCAGYEDCWMKVLVPAKYESVPQAPPPGYYEWRRHKDCEGNLAPAVSANPCK